MNWVKGGTEEELRKLWQEWQVFANLVEEGPPNKLLGIGVGHVLKVLAGGENVKECPRVCAHPHLGMFFVVIDLEA
jgi:hypothetical protein